MPRAAGWGYGRGSRNGQGARDAAAQPLCRRVGRPVPGGRRYLTAAVTWTLRPLCWAASGTAASSSPTAPLAAGAPWFTRLRGGHEVTQRVAVDGAEPGDAVAIRIRDITVTCLATASGHYRWGSGTTWGTPAWPPPVRLRHSRHPGPDRTRIHRHRRPRSRRGRCPAQSLRRTRGPHDAARYAALPGFSVEHPIPALRPPTTPWGWPPGDVVPDVDVIAICVPPPGAEERGEQRSFGDPRGPGRSHLGAPRHAGRC